MTNTSINEKINLFFSKPTSVPPHPTEFSPLHLLRRHVNICLCIDPSPPDHNYQAIWPGAMAVLAGIDLLGAYYSGKIKGTNKTFMDFCEKFLGLNNDDSEIIYMLRCAFIHTYGLITTNEIRRSVNYRKTYRFKVFYEEDKSWLIITNIDTLGREIYCINLHELYIKFESSVDKFCDCVKAEAVYANNFEKVYDQLGIIAYG